MFALSHRLDDRDNVATALHGRRSFLFLHVVTLRSGNSLFQDVRGESGSTDMEQLLRTKRKQKEETEVRMKMRERERESEREGVRRGGGKQSWWCRNYVQSSFTQPTVSDRNTSAL